MKEKMVRLDEASHRKMKVLAAQKGLSVAALLRMVVFEFIQRFVNDEQK